MTNYLDIMEVQQWQMRPEMVAKLKATAPVGPTIKSLINEDETLVSTENSVQTHEYENVSESHLIEKTLEVSSLISERLVKGELATKVSTTEESHEISENNLETDVQPQISQEQKKTPPTLKPIFDSKEDDVNQAEFFVYAAVSLRQYGNEQKRWLWIVDQASLSREEIKLLDNIVMATESEWEESGLADGYIGDDQLQSLLNDDISEVVLFGSSHVEFFVNKRVFVTSSISQLVADGDKKRQTWQGLKLLMQ